MEREFAFHLHALDRLLLGDSERNAQLIQGKRNLPADLRGVGDRRVKQIQQILGQLGRQLPPVEDDEWIQSEHAAVLRFLHPNGHVDLINIDDRLVLPGEAHRQGRICRDRREGRLEPISPGPLNSTSSGNSSRT